MSVSGQRKYTVNLFGRIADYTVVPLTDVLAAKYVDDVQAFHERSMTSDEDDRSDGTSYYCDYPEAENRSGLYLKKGTISVEDEEGETVFESRIEDVHDDLDFDDYVSLREASAFGLDRSCAVFSLPTDDGGAASYELMAADEFDIENLMLIATQFDEDGWFISKIFYDGEELVGPSSSGHHEENKSTIVKFVDGSFSQSASHVVHL